MEHCDYSAMAREQVQPMTLAGAAVRSDRDERSRA
jgi:hypothetical protein